MSDLRPPVHMSNDWTLVDRRIRHVTAIQIRNLTPFPARDSLASALTQPAEQSQFTSHGHLSDDLDVAMQRKRSRRISVNSVTTHRSMRSEDGTWEEGLPGGTMIERGRRTSGPRVSFPSEGGDHRQRATSGSAPTIRPHRARTSSMASTAASHTSSPSLSTMSHLGGSSSAAASSFSAMLPDNSQTGLEKVIQSRLVETFLAITIPQPSTPPLPPTNSAQPTSPLRSPTFRDKPSPSKPVEGNVARKVVKPPHLSPTEKSSAKARRDSATSPRLPQKPSLSHVKSASTSVLRTNGDVKRAPPHSTSAPLAQKPPSKLETSTPNYFSPIHRPSTHPYFAIDARSTHEFIEDTDCSGYEMRIEVWGRVNSRWREDTLGKGKEKEADGADSGAEWKVLEERNVDLRDLVPFSENFVTDNSQLPSNSLLITLSPPGETFYLPPHPPFRHRSPSPSGGYASDPESDVRRVKPTGMATPPATAALMGHSDATTTALSRRRHRGGVGAATVYPEEVSKTAGWQDLFKLVTLQSCILDNGRSLSDVVRGIDKSLEADIIFAQRREVSEREARLEELAAYHKKVVEEADQLRNQIQTRLDNLRQRKHLLKLAREQLEGEVAYEHEMEEAIVQDRALHSSLRSRFGPTRTTLLSILSSIYPIELLSPPDLLYTILDVPLPIPLSSSDPAPPLIMPLQKDVNEDAVATSLGYAAQVVQLLAAYLGKGLVYPVTCIGSRSLIKDNISAMVGPRMFPLYSKGVDTYRFEYGVFLLNKDIELLMADRDLRALDMRHTLPNLKNLLLTLTDGEGARLRQSRPPDSPMSLASNLGSLSRPGSPVDPNSITPKASDTAGLDGSTPPASGSTTPTAATTDASKKGRPFLAFSPLTDFLRGRYSSSSQISVKGSPNPLEEVHISKECHATLTAHQSSEQQASGGGDDDNDERKAISDISRAVSVVEGWKPVPAPIANGEEPALDEEDSPAHATPLLPLTRVR
ncbi:hypothetical protein D9615_006385 [Tricholomella constricta]|uniref:Autophagy-related protein 14 n=1 Tax=Tricholomella constricta TaxID=117010 RepID=A0A8H5H636_9AGAR|nr:hypothetical protein D9615_006385 [Tricholomella constricta]